MASSNVDTVRPLYEAWGRSDFRPSFDAYDDDMEWGWSDEFPGLAGVFRDTRDPNPRLRSWLSPWEEWQCVAEEYIELEDHVVVFAIYRGRGKDSGVPVDQEGAHVLRIRNGKIVRLVIYADRERALAAARAAETTGGEVAG